MSSAFLAFAAGIKQRIGFNTECRSFLLTKSVPYIEDRHEIECFLDVLRADKIMPKDNYLENWVTQQETEQVKAEMVNQGINFDNGLKRVIIHATSGNRKKSGQRINGLKLLNGWPTKRMCR